MSTNDTRDQNASNQNNAPSQRSGRSRRRSRRKRSSTRGGESSAMLSLDAQIGPDAASSVAAFVACGRCSFFLTGYRAIHGREIFAVDAVPGKDGWLTLRWTPEMSTLLAKSYGWEADDTLLHLEHSCRECRRVVVMERQEAEAGDGPLVLRAQLMPGS